MTDTAYLREIMLHLPTPSQPEVRYTHSLLDPRARRIEPGCTYPDCKCPLDSTKPTGRK